MYKTLIKSLAFIFLGLTVSAQDDPVLMTVGDTPVTVSEFKYIYEKNNGDKADYSKESLDEYLDLYIKFKLKVNKARQMRLDTVPELIEELGVYRKQLANSYLLDKEVTEKLLEELYERKKQDVEISHILVKASDKDANSKSKDALKRIGVISQQISGEMTFDEIVLTASEDEISAPKGGKLGYLTAMLPNGFYHLENAMYNQEVGEISDPVKTSLGYHIVKVTDKRPARGSMSIAHILIRKKIGDKVAVDARNRVNDLYKQLQEGADFAELAKLKSEDRKSSGQGGALGKISLGMYEKVFEDAAFALQNDGDISEPIESKIGWHIIKRIEKYEPDPYPVFKRKMQAKVTKDQRYTESKERLIENIKAENQFKSNDDVLKAFADKTDEQFYSYKWSPDVSLLSEVLFSFKESDHFTVKDFVSYCKKNIRERSRFSKEKPVGEAVEALFNMFVNEKAIEYEEKNLENKYPDFKSLMREYREGILLFEVSKISVWDKASSDTLGLYEFYEKNKSKYVWEEKAKLGRYIIHTDEEKQINKILKYAKKKSSEKVLEKYNKKEELLEYYEEEVEKSSALLAGIKWKKGAVSDLTVDNKSHKSSFRKIVDLMPSRIKTMNEARGYVIADYQDHLEDLWIKRLRMEFPVKINEEVVKSLTK